MQNGQTAEVIKMSDHNTKQSRRPDTPKTALSDAMRAAMAAFNNSIQQSMDGNNPDISAQTAQILATMAHQIPNQMGSRIYREVMRMIKTQMDDAAQQAHQQTRDIIQHSQRPVLFIDKSMHQECMTSIGYMLQRTDLMFICGDKETELKMRENGVCKGQFRTSFIGTMGCADSEANARCVGAQSDCLIHIGYAGIAANIGGADNIQQRVHFATFIPDNASAHTHTHLQDDKKSMIETVQDMAHNQHACTFSLGNAAWKYRCGKSSNRYAKNCYGLRNNR